MLIALKTPVSFLTKQEKCIEYTESLTETSIQHLDVYAKMLSFDEMLTVHSSLYSFQSMKGKFRVGFSTFIFFLSFKLTVTWNIHKCRYFSV